LSIFGLLPLDGQLRGCRFERDVQIVSKYSAAKKEGRFVAGILLFRHAHRATEAKALLRQAQCWGLSINPATTPSRAGTFLDHGASAYVRAHIEPMKKIAGSLGQHRELMPTRRSRC